MSKDFDILKELKVLLDNIDKYDDSYYNQSTSLVSDPEYDGLKDRLRTLSKEFIPTPGSKAHEKLVIRLNDALSRVGAPPPMDGKWPKVLHEVPMQSLNKVNIPQELSDWYKKCGSAKTLLCTEKLDGLSVSLKYENGTLIQGLSRGDGETGEDITRNVKKMQGVIHTLPENFTGHIRGEIILRHSDWKTYLPDMSNPRNAASGVAKRIDGYQSEYLTVLVYTIEGKDFKTELDAFDYLVKLGFSTPNYKLVDLKTATKLWQEYMDTTRNTLDYDIDGLVIRINDCAHQISLGEENHRPKGAIAFKFEAPEARTIIRNIVWQVGDTGRITPVAEFDTVELLGAQVERASLHNYSLVTELGVDIGAEVIVSRRNDVIPAIEKVTKGTGSIVSRPASCPDCDSDILQVGEYLVCSNKRTCPSQVQGRINKWVKEHNILEWGEAVLTKLIASGKVSDVADLYTLTVNDITSLERMGEKGANNLLTELDKFRTVPLENFLGGLCIEGVATSTVRSIIDAGYSTLDEILGLSINTLESISGFGEKRALAFHSGLIENADRIENILKAGVKIKDRAKGSLTGKSFCVTGSTNIPRAKLHKMIEDVGGEVKKSVGKGLNYLVIADPSSTSSKAQGARKLNTTLISEEDLIEMIKKK